MLEIDPLFASSGEADSHASGFPPGAGTVLPSAASSASPSSDSRALSLLRQRAAAPAPRDSSPEARAGK